MRNMQKQTVQISAMDVRSGIGKYFDRVTYGNERVKINRNGKPALAIVSEEDLQRLEALDQQGVLPKDTERIDRMYQGLSALFGMIKAPITDASTTIDDVLYGRDKAQAQRGSDASI
jgi:PHD/YefM family antitoxin component YafN of YafNO toxin-antitoxin module